MVETKLEQTQEGPHDSAGAAAARKGLYAVTTGFFFTFAGYGAIENLLSTFHSSCVRAFVMQSARSHSSLATRSYHTTRPVLASELGLMIVSCRSMTQPWLLLECYGVLCYCAGRFSVTCDCFQARDTIDDGNWRADLHGGVWRQIVITSWSWCLLAKYLDRLSAVRMFSTRYRSSAWSLVSCHQDAL